MSQNRIEKELGKSSLTPELREKISEEVSKRFLGDAVSVAPFSLINLATEKDPLIAMVASHLAFLSVLFHEGKIAFKDGVKPE